MALFSLTILLMLICGDYPMDSETDEIHGMQVSIVSCLQKSTDELDYTVLER